MVTATDTTVPARLACGCEVRTRPGELGRCPQGHDQDTPQHLRYRRPHGKY